MNLFPLVGAKQLFATVVLPMATVVWCGVDTTRVCTGTMCTCTHMCTCMWWSSLLLLTHDSLLSSRSQNSVCTCQGPPMISHGWHLCCWIQCWTEKPGAIANLEFYWSTIAWEGLQVFNCASLLIEISILQVHASQMLNYQQRSRYVQKIRAALEI